MALGAPGVPRAIMNLWRPVIDQQRTPSVGTSSPVTLWGDCAAWTTRHATANG